MRALITNDDGIDAPGLHALARAALGADLDTVIAAPAHEASGTSASLTAATDARTIDSEERALPGLDGVPAIAVAGTPGLIAFVAAHGGFEALGGEPPQVVLSGINRGSNIGRAVLHSGTVGAALTAHIHGIRALAVSLDVGLRPAETLHWDTAAHVAGEALRMLLDMEPGTVLNVNVPNVPVDDVRPLRRATLADFGQVQGRVRRLDGGHLEIVSIEAESDELDPGTDAALLAAGHPTITPLWSVAEAVDQTIPGLEVTT